MPEQHDDTGCCTECKSAQPDAYSIKQLKMGFDSFPCKFCGGVAVVMPKQGLKQNLKKSDERRGLI